MKMPLLEGRNFSPEEFILASTAAAATLANASAPGSNPAAQSTASAPSTPIPAIVNQTFARRCFGNVDAIGQRFGYLNPGQNDAGYVIIGMVRDAKYDSPRSDINPTTHVPAAGSGVAFELRTAASPTSILPAVQSIVSQVDSNLPIFNIVTESQSIDRLLFQERLIARLSSFFGLLALALACVGLYGLLSYEVTRRTRRDRHPHGSGGGATQCRAHSRRQGLGLAVTGVVTGIAAAIGVTRYLQSILVTMSVRTIPSPWLQ